VFLLSLVHSSAGRFASTLSAEERKAIHARVAKHGLKSQSVG
jgi:hypothetical protein